MKLQKVRKSNSTKVRVCIKNQVVISKRLYNSEISLNFKTAVDFRMLGLLLKRKFNEPDILV